MSAPSPEQPGAWETLPPQTKRFCGLVEDTPVNYGWAGAFIDEPQYATQFKADVRLGVRPGVVRCGLLDTGQGLVHRLVLSEGATDWYLDFATGQPHVRVILKDTEGSGPAMQIDCDDEQLDALLDRISEALEQLDVDDQASALEAQLAMDERAAFEAEVLAAIEQIAGPSN